MGVRSTDISAILNAIDNKTMRFDDVINYIDDYYRYVPVTFGKGGRDKGVGGNGKSAKIFALAKLHGLSQLDTLKLFAEHYDAVKSTPNGTDHANIRNFLHWGWQGFLMQDNPLSPRPDVNVNNI